jgi:peptidoglycan biosynthesis protein MviN/MurJ (putative lipid II flippase)
LATSLSSILNLILLSCKLGPKLGRMDMRKNIQSLIEILFCSLSMGFVAYIICSFGNWTVTGNIVEKVCLLGAGIVVGLGVYFFCSHWMKNEEMIFLLKMLRRKI